MKKFSITIIVLINLSFSFCFYGQNKAAEIGNPPLDTINSMDKLEYNLKTTHPNAQALMKYGFYWGVTEETGPIGNDDGWGLARDSGNGG
jgi:hypothetical protein